MTDMTFDYLDFEFSDDETGSCTWDALASVNADRVPALAAEIEQLLRWASQRFAGRQGALDEGADWDDDLQAQDDEGSALPVQFDSHLGRLQLAAAAVGRTTVSLSLSGTRQFGQALQEKFEPDSQSIDTE